LWEFVRKTAVEGDRLGYDSVWVPDHLIQGKGGGILECWTTVSALPSLTERIRLGLLVLCNSYRDPSLVAKMAATLDYISKGRLEFGIGAGWSKDEHLAYGIPFEKYDVRVQKLREAIDLMKKIWTGNTVNFDGRYYRVKDCSCVPGPVQRPHPPIWMGGTGDKMLKLIAESADGVNIPLMPLWGRKELIPDALNRLEKFCNEAGRNFNQIEKSVVEHVFIYDDEKTLKTKFDEFVRYYSSLPELVDFFTATRPESGGITPWITYEASKKSIFGGTLEQCAEKIEEYVDMGITHLLLRFPSFEMMRLFGEKMLPRFK
jgi:alkanesulfonate monooxygenase SsuD/methylene tetrahydromethanopterin reductase-like flavin-dependent oxidoreductase (luciferase family)